MFLPLIPLPTNADVKDKVIIQVGAPSVWSLGQAHYLLAQIQKRNRDLNTNMPRPDDLDPNGINATRIQILRTLLDVGAEYSQKVGVENQATLNEHKDKIKRRDEARAELKTKQEELDDVKADLANLNKRLATVSTELQQKKTEKERVKPNPTPPPDNLPTPPPDKAENDLEIEKADLTAKIQNKKDKQTALEADIKALKTEADKDVSLTGLTEVQPPSTSTALPQMSNFIQDAIKKTADAMGRPRFAASIALDNYVGMQYEILAKQLTLLRDEAGPDKRVIFLELPSSIYTPACKGDEYIAQVQWKVTGFVKQDDDEEALTDNEKNIRARYRYNEVNVTRKTPLAVQSGSNDQGASQFTMKDAFGEESSTWTPAAANDVRAVDIIPRQSALNVNDVQSTVSQKNFLGILKLLMGFGLRVNYQRQQELYEQYLQQEVFASGFGKGLNVFGWTFGPLPGTNRIAPGVRTTYAVLAVPRGTTKLKIEAKGIAFHRKDAPRYEKVADVEEGKVDAKQIVFGPKIFEVGISGENTERFFVDSMYYTPARKGDAVTVVVKGRNFSPQMGVLVDGVALAKSLSLGNTATSDAVKDAETTGIHGQFELVSSRELVMRFAMGDAYVGTPNLTLVTPEKSSALNFLDLLINNHRPNTMLRDLVVSEPMFVPNFKLEGELFGLQDYSASGFSTARLKGTGLRRKADVWVNDVRLDVFRDQNLKMRLFREYTPGHTDGYEDLMALKLQFANGKVDAVCRARPNPCTADERASYAKYWINQWAYYDDLYKEVKRHEIARLMSSAGGGMNRQQAEDEVKRLYETPPDVEEYAIEESTGQYSLRFKTATDGKYSVRYRQNAIHGVDETEFTHKDPRKNQKEFALMHYAPNAKTGKAILDVRFKSTTPVLCAKISPASQGKPLNKITDEGNNQYRGVFEVDYDNLGSTRVEKESVSISLFTESCNKTKDPIKTFDIPITVRPQVAKASLSVLLKDGEETSVITFEGVNLQNIVKVVVGDKEADVIGSPENGILVIRLPKGISIKEDAAVQVPVVLKTKDGTQVSVVATVGNQKVAASAPAPGNTAKKKAKGKRKTA
jgi:hypothetical protein